MVAPHTRRMAFGIVMGSLACIVGLTLTPAPPSRFASDALCVICGPLGGVDFVLNIALFVPLGIGLFRLLGRVQPAMAVGIAVTLVVESLQWRVIPGRDASLGDLLANTLGTGFGAWVAMRAPIWARATGAAARRLSISTAVLAAAVVCGSAWLLTPVPTRSQQWVLWMAPRPSLEPFQGRLQEVTLNGVPIHATERLPAARLVDGGTRSTTVRAVIGGTVPPTGRQSMIVSISNPVHEGFFLGQWRDAVVFRTHLNASRARLRSVLAALDGAFASDTARSAGARGEDRLTIEARSTRQGITLVRSGTVGQIETKLPRNVGLAWALILPWDIALGPSWWLANAAWLGCLAMPATFFAARARRSPPDEARDGSGWWPVALVLSALVVAPALTGISQLGAGEWSGVAAGILAGAVLARLTSEREIVKA